MRETYTFSFKAVLYSDTEYFTVVAPLGAVATAWKKAGDWVAKKGKTDPSFLVNLKSLERTN